MGFYKDGFSLSIITFGVHWFELYKDANRRIYRENLFNMVIINYLLLWYQLPQIIRRKVYEFDMIIRIYTAYV